MREPIVGMVPLFLTFSAFFANGGKGWYSQKIPMAAVIMVFGTILWWIGLSRHDTEKRELNDPTAMGEVLANAADTIAFKNNMSPFVTLGGFSYMKDNAVAIVFPIALASFIETIENVEMASIVGDSYNVKEAMLADGCGTIVGALFGSVIPTTVYIGHKRHKVAGAHYFYSVLNALAYFILLLSGPHADPLLPDRRDRDLVHPHRRRPHDRRAGARGVRPAPLPVPDDRHHVPHRRHALLRPL